MALSENEFDTPVLDVLKFKTLGVHAPESRIARTCGECEET